MDHDLLAMLRDVWEGQAWAQVDLARGPEQIDEYVLAQEARAFEVGIRPGDAQEVRERLATARSHELLYREDMGPGDPERDRLPKLSVRTMRVEQQLRSFVERSPGDGGGSAGRRGPSVRDLSMAPLSSSRTALTDVAAPRLGRGIAL